MADATVATDAAWSLLAPHALPDSWCVLLIVDMINPMRVKNSAVLRRGAWAAAQQLRHLKDEFHARRLAVLYANDNYGHWDRDFSSILAACQDLRGQPGRIARLLAPAPRDLVVLKPQHSAFHSTPLEHLLKTMRTRAVVIGGVATDMCVQLTALDARMRGYHVWVPRDANAAESATRRQGALRQLSLAFDCDVTPLQRMSGAALTRQLKRLDQPLDL